MKKFLIGAIASIALSTQLTGCLAPKSYVDPQYRLVTPTNSISQPAQAIPVKVSVNFQRNGKDLPRANKELQAIVDRSLRSTGVFVPTESLTTPSISVNANNIADLGKAGAKGAATGLTFGAVGSTVTDNYEFNFKYNDAQGAAHDATFKHALVSTIGNAKGPEGQKPVSPITAFNQIVEDVVQNFVKKLQDEGVAPSK